MTDSDQESQVDSRQQTDEFGPTVMHHPENIEGQEEKESEMCR